MKKENIIHERISNYSSITPSKKKKKKKIHQKIENFEKNPPLPIYRRAACSTRRDQIMQIGKRLRDATRPTPAAQCLSFIRGYGPIYKGRA